MGPENGFRLGILDNAPMLILFEQEPGPDSKLRVGEVE
jgi:hypothetical protein